MSLQLEEQLHELRQRCSATERLQSESMHQLTVARRLLADAASGPIWLATRSKALDTAA